MPCALTGRRWRRRVDFTFRELASMPGEKLPNAPTGRRVLLRRMDQAAIAGLMSVALLSMAGYWLTHHGHRGGLIDIDRAEPLEARFRVDVNSAQWPELAQLPDIGEVLARRIVESREQAGPFIDHSDLRRVRGIGPLTLERIQPYLLPLPGGNEVAGGGNAAERGS
jgi:competence protein ComEA